MTLFIISYFESKQPSPSIQYVNDLVFIFLTIVIIFFIVVKTDNDYVWT